MMRKALGVTAALVAASLITVAVAQSRRIPSPIQDQINRALIEGRFGDVASLASGLDPQDPTVAALVQRAAIARGQYDAALNALQPVAQRFPTSDAGLERALLLQDLGRPEAGAALATIAAVAPRTSDPYELARAARALHALNRSQEADAAYRDAVRTLPRDPAVKTAYGDFLNDKYLYGEAAEQYQDALKIDAKFAPALLGLANAFAEQNPPQAVKFAQQALEINASSVATLAFLAAQHADAGRRDDARKLLTTALEVNPSSLQALSRLAALDFIQDRRQESEAGLAKALSINPRYGEAYRIVAETAAHNFRYDDAAAFGRRAAQLDPNGPILRDLGIHLLRTGEEAEAREVLERSFALDAFSQITKNLLDMMDKLDGFVTVRDGNLILRLDKNEAPVLAEPALALSHEALDNYSKRYGFTPKGPILIEIFPRHDDFAVRIGGLPGMIGALGVCFGRVVTLDSPNANRGTFQWEATLWHELAHVITLQMSNYRLPRWLTEGISVYEETLKRTEWGRGMEMQFASMLNNGETLKLRDLNAAFTDGRTIMLAYYQASLLVEHIVSVYGEEGLHRLLRAYGEGLDTDAAIRKALDTDLDGMQAGFDRTIDQRFGSLRKALTVDKSVELPKMPVDALKVYASTNPDSYAAHMVLGTMLRRGGDLDGALQAFERAAVLAPMATGDDSPHEAIADIALQRNDPARAIRALQAALVVDFDNVGLARKLAALMRENKVTDMAALQPVYERIVAIDPFDAEAQAALGRLAMQANQPDRAIGNFKAVIALKPVDQAAAYTDLAESYFRSGKRADARRQTLAALEIAPSYERAQNLLLELAEGRP